MFKKVLLVEDEALIALSEAQILKKNGFEVELAYSGRQAIEKTEADEEINLVLMDIDLGAGMDGTEAAEQIIKARDLPIVFLTSHTEKEYVDRVEKITGYGYIMKNSGEMVLIRSINMAYKLYEAHQRLKEREIRYKTLFESAYEAILIMDAHMFIDCNHSALQFFGCTSKDELIGHSPWEFSPEYQPNGSRSSTAANELINAALRGRPENFYWTHQRKDGTRFQTEVTLHPLVLGNETYVQANLRGLSDKEEMEKQVEEGKAVLKTFLNQIPGAAYVKDSDNRIVFCNKLFASILKASPEELEGRDISSHVPRETERRCEQENRSVLEHGRIIQTESEFPINNENTYWLTYKFPIQFAGRTMVGAISIDLTAQKQMEKKLRTREQQFRAIADYTYDWEDWIGTDGSLIWVNPAVERISGYTPEECYRMKYYPLSLIHPEDRHESNCEIKAGLKHKTSCSNRELRCICKDGSVKWISVSRQPIYDNKGQHIGTRSSMRDITDSKATEDELNRTIRQKEFLLKELNHRVKNNLAMVSSLLSLKDTALGNTVDLSDLKHRVDTIRIIHEKLNYSEDYATVQLREYIQDVLESIFSSFTDRQVQIQNKVEEIDVSTKIAIPLGLIANEIATNAMKYGFPEGERPVFTVDFQQHPEEHSYTFILSNSGAEFPEDIDIATSETLGLKLVSTLVLQLQGSINLQRSPHPVFTIDFPMNL
ncbi:MAG: PAS domain S-box protein [Spirochaetota bacterium]